MSTKIDYLYFVILVFLCNCHFICGGKRAAITDEEIRNVGTILFSVDGGCSDCLNNEDAALLRARQEFDLILPFNKNIIMNEKSIEVLIEYFFGANEIIHRMSSGNDKTILLRAYFDTIGGYLHHYLIPITKFSFYAGEISLRSVRFILDLMEHAKNFLNTNGLGWAEPINDFEGFIYKIEPIKISLDSRDQDNGDTMEKRSPKPSPCVLLMLLNDENSEEDIIVPLPKVEIEENGMLTNMWLPYKRKHIFNLQSKSSAYILLKYYVDVAKCYKFQDICLDSFNKKFYRWLYENIVPHLFGDVFYPSLGAVLRILETAKTGNNTIVLSGNQIMDQVNHKSFKSAIPISDPDDDLFKITQQVRTIASAQSGNVFGRFFGYQNAPTSKEEADKLRKDFIKFFLLLVVVLFIVVAIIAYCCQRKKTQIICKTVIDPTSSFYQRCKQRCFGSRTTSCNKNDCVDEIDIKCESSAISGGPSPRCTHETGCCPKRKSGCCPMSTCFADDKKKKCKKHQNECPHPMEKSCSQHEYRPAITPSMASCPPLKKGFFRQKK